MMKRNDQEQTRQVTNGIEGEQQGSWPPPIPDCPDQKQQTAFQDRGSWFVGSVLGFMIFIIGIVSLEWVRAGYVVHQIAVYGYTKYAASFSRPFALVEYVCFRVACNVPNLLIFLLNRKRQSRWGLGVLCGGGLGILFNIFLAYVLRDYVR